MTMPKQKPTNAYNNEPMRTIKRGKIRLLIKSLSVLVCLGNFSTDVRDVFVSYFRLLVLLAKGWKIVVVVSCIYVAFITDTVGYRVRMPQTGNIKLSVAGRSLRTSLFRFPIAWLVLKRL